MQCAGEIEGRDPVGDAPDDRRGEMLDVSEALDDRRRRHVDHLRERLEAPHDLIDHDAVLTTVLGTGQQRLPQAAVLLRDRAPRRRSGEPEGVEPVALLGDQQFRAGPDDGGVAPLPAEHPASREAIPQQRGHLEDPHRGTNADPDRAGQHHLLQVPALDDAEGVGD